MTSQNPIILDRLYAVSRTDVIGSEMVQVKIARPEPFQTKNAKGEAATVENYELIREMGKKDAEHFKAVFAEEVASKQ